MRFISFLFVALLFFSCGHNKQPVTIDHISSAQKPIEVNLIGTLRTRRSYAATQFMKDEREIQRYEDSVTSSDPLVTDLFPGSDSSLLKQFSRLGFIDSVNNAFTFSLNKFPKKEAKEADQILKNGDTIHVKFYDADEKTHFKVFYKTDSIFISTDATNLQNLDYAFLDIIPGGNKELVFLDDIYIMNGFNYDYKVYEIKTHH